MDMRFQNHVTLMGRVAKAPVTVGEGSREITLFDLVTRRYYESKIWTVLFCDLGDIFSRTTKWKKNYCTVLKYLFSHLGPTVWLGKLIWQISDEGFHRCSTTDEDGDVVDDPHFHTILVSNKTKGIHNYVKDKVRKGDRVYVEGMFLCVTLT